MAKYLGTAVKNLTSNAKNLNVGKRLNRVLKPSIAILLVGIFVARCTNLGYDCNLKNPILGKYKIRKAFLDFEDYDDYIELINDSQYVHAVYINGKPFSDTANYSWFIAENVPAESKYNITLNKFVPHREYLPSMLFSPLSIDLSKKFVSLTDTISEISLIYSMNKSCNYYSISYGDLLEYALQIK